jgi:NDP-sugar pyrophosphorylase family protein
MKAYIVAAGLGTRLRPLTYTTPKCMIDIGGRPLLWYHIMQLKYHGITDLWINTHLLPDIVTSYFDNGSRFGVQITYSFEPELLGTSGALKNPGTGITEAFSREKEFIVTYADNFTNIDYSKLIDFHHLKKSFMTIAANHSEEPWTKGVIEIDSDSKIIRMVEKPPRQEVQSDLTNAGIYLCSSEILSLIPPGNSDFAADIVPRLKDTDLYCYVMDEYLQDTGTPERYAKAQSDLKNIIFPF